MDTRVDFQQAARVATYQGRVGKTLEESSHDQDSIQITGLAGEACVSDDGRYVAFCAQKTGSSWSGTSDRDRRYDIFLKDRMTGTVERISNGIGGAEPNDSSSQVTMSADGQLIAFASKADNLVEGDGNRATDIFLHDRRTGQTRLVSTASDGTQANHSSFCPKLSADGSTIAFLSQATNLAPDATAFREKVVVKELATGLTEVISRTTDGREGRGAAGQLSISGDGRRVAFAFGGYPLDPNVQEEVDPFAGPMPPMNPQIYVKDRQTQTLEHVSRSGQVAANERCIDPCISRDGSRIAFSSLATNLIPGDVAATLAVYVASQDGALEKISGDRPGTHPSLSGDGKWIAWESQGQIELKSQEGERMVLDRPPGIAEFARQPPLSKCPQLSADGNTVVFLSQEFDTEVRAGMHSRVYAFDFEHARAELNWAGEPRQQTTPGVEVSGSHVTVNGVRLRRRAPASPAPRS